MNREKLITIITKNTNPFAVPRHQVERIADTILPKLKTTRHTVSWDWLPPVQHEEPEPPAKSIGEKMFEALEDRMDIDAWTELIRDKFKNIEAKYDKVAAELSNAKGLLAVNYQVAERHGKPNDRVYLTGEEKTLYEMIIKVCEGFIEDEKKHIEEKHQAQFKVEQNRLTTKEATHLTCTNLKCGLAYDVSILNDNTVKTCEECGLVLQPDHGNSL